MNPTPTDTATPTATATATATATPTATATATASPVASVVSLDGDQFAFFALAGALIVSLLAAVLIAGLRR